MIVQDSFMYFQTLTLYTAKAVHPPLLFNLQLDARRFEQQNFSDLSKGEWFISARLNQFIVKIRFRINHLQQDVEQVDGHVHAEVDGVRWQKEVEGHQVRILILSFNLLLIWKLTLEMIEAIYLKSDELTVDWHCEIEFSI